jgi:hypothetical protein
MNPVYVISLTVNSRPKEITNTSDKNWIQSAIPTPLTRTSGNFETHFEQFLDKPTITTPNLDTIVPPPTMTLSLIYNDAVLRQSLLTSENSGDLENSYISVNQSAIWTPEVISATLALMPIILSISVVCVMVLFMLLHCFAPKETTHVTNNSYTTKLFKRSTSDQGGGPNLPMDGPPSLNIHRNHGETIQNNPITQTSNIRAEECGAPSQNNHRIPQAHRSGIPLIEPSPRMWHHGLLNMWNQEDTSWEYPLSSVNEIPAYHDKNELTDRRMDPECGINQDLGRRESNSTHILYPNTGSAPDERFVRASLTTGLQDNECGRETLRYRRTRMRDQWLSHLFLEKNPIAQNVGMVEQLDGIQRGVAIGGAGLQERSVEAEIDSRAREDILISSQFGGNFKAKVSISIIF